MKHWRLAMAALAALCLAACYPPVTRYPVGNTAPSKADPVLSGLWKGMPASAEDRGAYFHFLPRRDGTISVFIVQAGDKPDGDWNYVTLTTAKLGSNRFMNARMLLSNGIQEGGDPSVQPAGTVPVLYRIDAKGQMTLYMMDETATKAAIKAHKIKGDPGKGDMGDAVITADPVALDKFLQSPAGLALFAKPFFTLHRME